MGGKLWCILQHQVHNWGGPAEEVVEGRIRLIEMLTRQNATNDND